jgi:hypothetical protein
MGIILMIIIFCSFLILAMYTVPTLIATHHFPNPLMDFSEKNRLREIKKVREQIRSGKISMNDGFDMVEKALGGNYFMHGYLYIDQFGEAEWEYLSEVNNWNIKL